VWKNAQPYFRIRLLLPDRLSVSSNHAEVNSIKRVKLRLNSKSVLRVLVAIWLLGTGGLFFGLVSYSATSGASGHPPSSWPLASHIARAAGKPTLIMILHPHCPSARASLNELSVLPSRVDTPFNSTILFVKPPTAGDDWEKTDTWHIASAMQGVNVMVDVAGTETQIFDSHTSGQVMLYGVDGDLLFTGGITVARGHIGDNEGLKTLIEVLSGTSTEHGEAAVFGCPLLHERDLVKKNKELRSGSHQ
jgi:hypothetical protein